MKVGLSRSNWRSGISLAVFATALAAAGSASAQDAPAPAQDATADQADTSEIVVTGSAAASPRRSTPSAARMARST